MSTETLTTILIVLLSVNFVLWIIFLIFLLVQIRKVFNAVHEILGNINEFSSSFMSKALSVLPLVFGVLKSFKAVKSITTLSDAFDFRF